MFLIKNKNTMKKILLLMLLFPTICLAEKELSDKQLGKCKNLDSYIYHCQKFQCEMIMPVPIIKAKLEFIVKGKENGLCLYNYRIIANDKNTLKDWIFGLKCALSQKGILQAVKDFQDYKGGNMAPFSASPTDNILRTECKTTFNESL